MASLFVIQGADQGKRFEFMSSPVALGRDSSSAVRLHDTEVSRRHAELRLDRNGYRIIDLASANGTQVNGQTVEQTVLHSGDRVQLGQTVMLFHEGNGGGHRDLTARVDLLTKSSPDDRSAILKSIPSGRRFARLEGSGRGGRLVTRQTLEPVGHVPRDPGHQRYSRYRRTLAPDPRAGLRIHRRRPRRHSLERRVRSPGSQGRALARRARARRRMTISQTIVDYVLEKGEGVITTDAPTDKRFSTAQSIVDFQIREAICVPIQGRHTTLGVLYADIQAGGIGISPSGKSGARGRFSQDQLMLMVAIGHQAGLAIENTIFYNDKIQAERLAAVGQTIATLSHHIKNILQGIHGGSSLIDLGLKEKDDTIVRRGWTIVEKNQTKIYNMVMDMLSFSKDREPALEPTDLNETVGDVIELMQSRATELGVTLAWSPGECIPRVTIDPEGIHRAVLNIVTNGIDACEGAENAQVVVKTQWDPITSIARISVSDNGVGIDEAEIPSMFQIFASSKGSRGTGLGLPVSQKIVREHGGKIIVTSRPGQGATFLIELPMTGRADRADREADGLTMFD